jgi:hypothetical protein
MDINLQCRMLSPHNATYVSLDTAQSGAAPSPSVRVAVLSRSGRRHASAPSATHATGIESLLEVVSGAAGVCALNPGRTCRLPVPASRLDVAARRALAFHMLQN